LAFRSSIITNLSIRKDFRNEYEVIDWLTGFRSGNVSCGLGVNVISFSLVKAKFKVSSVSASGLLRLFSGSRNPFPVYFCCSYLE
jgi:hypothetical protein